MVRATNGVYEAGGKAITAGGDLLAAIGDSANKLQRGLTPAFELEYAAADGTRRALKLGPTAAERAAAKSAKAAAKKAAERAAHEAKKLKQPLRRRLRKHRGPRVALPRRRRRRRSRLLSARPRSEGAAKATTAAPTTRGPTLAVDYIDADGNARAWRLGWPAETAEQAAKKAARAAERATQMASKKAAMEAKKAAQAASKQATLEAKKAALEAKRAIPKKRPVLEIAYTDPDGKPATWKWAWPF